ncbi:MAG: YVTN family beta-propeller protein [Pseudoalteromonas tetraodonis]|jgi:YVTN family beta-propeller protein
MRSLCFFSLIAAVSALLANPCRADFVNFETPQVHPIDLSPDGSTLAVCNTADNRVEFFDLSSGTPQPIGSVVVGIDPVSARFESDTSIWVVNQLSDTVSVVDVPNRIVLSTLQTDDEPADVVFSPGLPRRAFVSCSQANSLLEFDPAQLGNAPTPISIDGEDPRALAIDLSGNLCVAFFESGNGTTILGGGGGAGDGTTIDFPPNAVNHSQGPYGGTNPPPNKGSNFEPTQKSGNPPAPEVGLIVRRNNAGAWLDDNSGNWTAMVSGSLASASGRIQGWGLMDHDVGIVALSPGPADGYAGSLMNICMAIAVNPVNGHVTVVGTEATNEIRFEPNVNGTFVRVMFASFDPNDPGGAVVTTDLNAHLDYTASTVSQAVRDQSIGDPRGIAWKADGTKAYITGMGSNNLVVVDQTGARSGAAPTIEVGEGPTGIVVDDARARLYVLNRFEGSVSVVGMASEIEIMRVPLFDPTPAEIKIGRSHLYDTHQTSGLGQTSCASCHVDSRTDRLAWDLGDPGGEMVNVEEPRHNLGAGIPELTEDFTDFHPMKGPMTTQTLQDIIGKEPHHWRGDRDGIEAFNGAFESLLGDDTGLTTVEMQEFEDYLATITIPPNPFRNLDNTLPTSLPLPDHVTGARFGSAGLPMPNGNALRGFNEIYRPLEREIDGEFACVTCHTIPTGLGTDSYFSLPNFMPLSAGPMGERHHALVSVDGSTQRAIKIPQTRTLYDKLGFDLTSTASRSGFGVLHDGSVDGVSRFLSEGAFDVANEQEVADLVALMMAFSGSDFPGTAEIFEPPGTPSQDAHAAVGQQETVVSAEANSRLDLFFSLADALKIELVAHSIVSGNPRGWHYIGGDQFAIDQAGGMESSAELLARATDSEPITFTCAANGCGVRLGLDRDRDGIRDYDELRDFAPSITGHQNPFQDNSRDSTGDNGSTEPDGVPDGQNDFDGDGSTNAAELAAGTNPANNLSVEVPLKPIVTANGDRSAVTLSWDAAPLGEYLVQYSDALDEWTDSPTGSFTAPVSGGSLTWTDNGPPSTSADPGITPKRFYRIVRFQ